MTMLLHPHWATKWEWKTSHFFPWIAEWLGHSPGKREDLDSLRGNLNPNLPSLSYIALLTTAPNVSYYSLSSLALLLKLATWPTTLGRYMGDMWGQEERHKPVAQWGSLWHRMEGGLHSSWSYCPQWSRKFFLHCPISIFPVTTLVARFQKEQQRQVWTLAGLVRWLECSSRKLKNIWVQVPFGCGRHKIQDFLLPGMNVLTAELWLKKGHMHPISVPGAGSHRF